MAGETLILRHRASEYHVEVMNDGRVRIGDRLFRVTCEPAGVVRIDNEPPRTVWTAASDDMRWVFLDGRVYEFEVQKTNTRQRRSGRHYGSLTAPMPGTVRRVSVAPGDAVKRGDILVVLEAMKMELPLRATADGRVRAVRCKEGELVQSGVSLVELDE